MDRARTRRLIVIAFALSLFIHVLVASGLRWPLELRSRDETEIVHVQHLHLTRIAHVPTPPPRTPPPQTPPPRPIPAPSRAAPPVTHSTSGSGPAGTATFSPATARPTPIATVAALPTAKPCEHNDLPAALAASPPPPEISPQARADATSGTSRIRVTLDANGVVQTTAVASSSGSSSLDLVALSMARAAQYTPAQHDCKAVASDYVFSVKFVSW